MTNKSPRILDNDTTSNNWDGMDERLRKYILCFNQAKVGLVIGTAGGNLLELINPYFAEMHGYSVKELTGRPVEEVFAPECRSELPKITELIQEIGYYTYESKHVKKDGTVFSVLTNASTVYDHKKRAKYRIDNVVDLTEMKKKESKIQQLYTRTNTLVRASLMINAQLELDEVLRTICQEASVLLKASGALVYLLDQTSQTLQLSSAYGKHEERFVQTLPTELFERYFREREQVSVIPDLRVIHDYPFEQIVQRLNITTVYTLKLYNNDELSGAIFIFRCGTIGNVSEEDIMLLQGLASQASIAIHNARLYTKLRNNKKKLQELHHQVLQAQEEERHRISRELHDEVGQALTGLKMKLEMIADNSCPNCVLKGKFAKTIKLIDETLESTRHIAYDLRPPGLETVGLKAVLLDYCRTFSRRAGLPIHFEGSDPQDLSQMVSICFYRVLQEALTNVAKHAKSSRIEVRLQSDAEFLSLEVVDDGVGIDYTIGPHEAGMDGIGILGMKERVEALGGTLEIISRPGKGLCLTARVPQER